MNELTYTKNGDYFIPDITIRRPSKSIGHYGMLRRVYPKGFRPILYNELILSEELYPHCAEIDEVARSRIELMMPELAKSAGATEELKASDQMKWVGLMNTCKTQAEEVVKHELIYI
jgi:hypothetical protein